MAEQPFWSYHCNLTTTIYSFWAWSEPFTFSMLVFSPTFQKCARVILPLYTLTTTINLEKVFSYLDQRKILINLIIGATQLSMALHYPSILFNLESPVNPTQLSACLWSVGGRLSTQREPKQTLGRTCKLHKERPTTWPSLIYIISQK